MLTAILLFYYQAINSGNISTSTIKDYAIAESIASGVDQNKVVNVISGESGFIPTKVHYNDGKKGCDSVGLVQIRNCDHKEVSYEQATNPIFAVNFLIKNIDKCETWWKATCVSK